MSVFLPPSRGSILTADAQYRKLCKPAQAGDEVPFKFSSGSPRKFIGFVAKTKASIDETMSNVRIDIDGDVEQVWFDYNLNGSYKENWGKGKLANGAHTRWLQNRGWYGRWQ